MHLSIAAPRRTSRLVLRGIVPGDAPALLAFYSLAEVCRYVPFEPFDAVRIDERLAGHWARREIAGDGDGLTIAMERVDTGELVGDIFLALNSTEHRGGEIGWMLHPGQSGHGFATEAAHGVLHLAFGELGLHRVVARVDARNGPSLRLCERLGMRREATLVENEWFKGEWSDEVDFALLEGEWAAQHADGAGSCRWPLGG